VRKIKEVRLRFELGLGPRRADRSDRRIDRHIFPTALRRGERMGRCGAFKGGRRAVECSDPRSLSPHECEIDGFSPLFA
jgi:hypothetical protein